MVREACITQNPLRLGEAAALGTIAGETRCYLSTGFTALLSLVEECDLYGLNVAHSGSVVGLMLDRKRHDVRTEDKLAEKLTRHWPKQHLLSRWSLAGQSCSESLIYAPHCRSAYSALHRRVSFSPIAQLFGNVATLFGDFGIFNDVIVTRSS